MKVIQKKRSIPFLFFIFLTALACPLLRAEEITEPVPLPSGVIALKDFKHPVAVYIPQGLRPERNYPLLIAIPDFGKSVEENIEIWKNVANRRSLIILSPEFLSPRDATDVPAKYDQWLMEVKSLVSVMYPINTEKIFLIGNNESAEYAAYLAVNNPEDFSAVALVGGSWVGKFEKLMQLGTRPSQQLPIFVVFKADQEKLYKETESDAADFSNKGYPIKLIQFKKDEEYLNSEFKKQLLEWMDERSQEWSATVSKSRKTTREKIRRWFKNFFIID